MKKLFNKNIFKDKSFIKMICFTIVLLLVLVLGNTFGYVSADVAYEYCLNQDDYNSSSLYLSDIDTNYIKFYARNHISHDTYSHLSDIDFTNLSNGFDMDSIKYYAVQLGTSSHTFYFFDNEPKIFFHSQGGYQLQLPSNSHAYKVTVRFTTNGWELWDFTVDSTTLSSISLNNGTWAQLDNVLLSYANFPIYTVKQGWHSEYGDIYSAFNQGFVAQTGTNYFVNMNYFSDSAIQLEGFNNLENVGNNNDSPNASNYMFADSADWYLNNFNGQIQDKYRTVSAVFTSNLNDYINDSLILGDENTDSEYTIDFDFYADVEFYYSYVVGSTEDSNLPSVTIGSSFVQSSIDTSGNGEGYNNLYKWSCSYDAPVSMGNYLSGMHVDASTFADNNYSMSFPLSSLFAYMEPTNSYVVNPNGEKTKITITLQTLMYMWSNGFIGRNNSLVSEQFNLSKFNLTCKATINYGDAFTDLGHLGQYESGSYTETFDLLSGQSTVDDDSMLTNYNPYVDNTSEDYSNLPSTNTGSNSNSTTVTTGNVTQTVTVTNDGAQYIPSLISKLIPTSLSDTGTGLVSTFSDMAQTNGWISVMASTVPAIPSTIWTYLTNYLGISLYLLACAFVLRLILDLL